MYKAIMMVAGLVLASAAGAVDLKDDAALKAQFEKLQKAFNATDAKGVAVLFSDDGDVINPVGLYAKGRAEIEKLVMGDFERLAGATSTFAITDWRYIGEGKNLVLINGTHEFKGGKGAMPEGKVLLTTIMAKRAGQWMCIAARPMVPVRPPADAPKPVAAPAPSATTSVEPVAAPAVPAPK